VAAGRIRAHLGGMETNESTKTWSGMCLMLAGLISASVSVWLVVEKVLTAG
jgi:hypothetical protein